MEYIGKGAHPPPPPAYANVKIPQVLQSGPVAEPVPILATGAPPLFASHGPAVHPSAVPFPVLTATAVPPLGLGLASFGAPVQEYDPVKIKINSLPVNGPFPVVDPYAVGYGYGLDPAFAASTNKISRKRALLYDRTLFRKDVEKRTAIRKKLPKPSTNSDN